MRSKTKIVVIKLKDLLFYATVAVLCVIVLLLLYILFQPETAATSSTISVKIGCSFDPQQTNELTQLSE